MTGDEKLADAALAWFTRHARSLPWREPGTDPWAVLVSEVMLQQTPVARVLPAYRDWLGRWPDAPALAAASPGDVVRQWGRLGYPRRALWLHHAAKEVVARFGGELPRDVEQLRSLPGVGAYTAHAVAAFAFGMRVPVVDTNVRRVVARAVDGRGAAGAPSPTRDHAAVAALLPSDAATAARFGAALMELGALVCTARAPRCGECPLSDRCAWLRAGAPAPAARSVPAQRFAGTDRQVRGLLLDVLRRADEPVRRTALDAVWTDDVQRERALDSLVVDGLVDPLPDGRYALPA